MTQDLFRDSASRPEEEEELRNELCKIAAPFDHGASKALFQQGEECRGVFLVHRGKVSLFVSLPNGLRLPFPGHQGWPLGLPATMTGKPYSLTAEVESSAEVTFAEKKDALELLCRRPELLWPATRMIADELQQLRVVAAQWTWLALSKQRDDTGDFRRRQASM